MADIFREVDEALREDKARALWNRYRNWIVGVALTIVLATATFVWWQNWTQSRNQNQTAALEAARVTGLQDAGAGADAMSGLAVEASGGRAVLARFYEAGLLAEAGDRQGAALAYQALSEEGGLSAPWGDLARLLAGLHGLEAGDDPEDIRDRIGPLADGDGPWRYSAREILALVDLRAGLTADAADAFRQLAEDPVAPADMRERADELVRALEGRGP